MTPSELSPQDSLRLNVLLAQKPLAIRINESTMTLHALTERGEATIKLHPQSKDEPYISQIKKILSNHAFGQPNGYPVHLTRWTRMGQNRHGKNLAKLLLLAEPEAVTAAVYSPDLTPKLAKQIWWIDTNAEHARQMLTHSSIVKSDLAPELVSFLLEFLPFEVEPLNMTRSVALVLQDDLLNEAEQHKLWKSSKRKINYTLGFLIRLPDNLPITAKPHSQYETIQQCLANLLADNNPYAQQCVRLLSPAGQAYLTTVNAVMDKMAHQDIVVNLFNTLSHYFTQVPKGISYYTLDDAIQANQTAQQQPETQTQEWQNFHQQMQSNYTDIAQALHLLTLLDEHTLTSILSKTDAMGSVMRKRLEPITSHVKQNIAMLQG